MEERHLSLNEVAQLLDKSERTIRRWVKSGKLKAYKPGRDYLIPVSAVTELIERSEVYPKAQLGLPFEDPEEVLAEQQRQRFLQQAPSEDERVRRLRQVADIAAGYAARWHEERRHVEEEGTHPYGKSIEMGQLQEGFFEAITNDGVYPYMIWVISEDVEVATAEREACLNLDDALSDMLEEIGHMRQVESLNKQRASAEVERGLEDLQKSLVRAPQEGNSKGVAAHREEPTATGRSSLEVYTQVGNAQAARWEQEIDARIESANDNHGAFFVWSVEVVRSILTIRNSVIPKGLPFPRDPVSDPLFENEAVTAAWKTDYRERELIRKIRNAKRQHLPGPDEIDRQLQELLEQPEPVAIRSGD